MNKIFLIYVISTLFLLNESLFAEKVVIGKPFIQYGHTDKINALGLSSNSKYLISASEDKSLKVWDTQNAKEIKTLEEGNYIFALDIYDNDSLVLRGGSDRKLKLWNFETGELLISFSAHSGPVTAVKFIQGTKYALSGSTDKTIKLWDLKNKRLIRTFYGHKESINSIVVLSDQTHLFTASDDKTIKQWNLSSGNLVKTYTGHKNKVTSISITNDNKYLVSSGWDKTIKIWDIATAKVVRNLKGHNTLKTSTFLSENNDYIISSGWDNKVNIWSFKTGKILKTFDDFEKGVNISVMSKDQKVIISGDTWGSLTFWTLNSNKVVKSSTAWIYDMALTPDKNSLFVGGLDNKLYLWNLKSASLVKNFIGHTDGITRVSVSSDGKKGLSSSRDGSVKVWDLKKGKELKTFSRDKKNLISPFKNQIITLDNHQIVRYWDINTGKEIFNKLGFLNPFTDKVVESSDNNFVLFSENVKDNATIELWDIKNNRLIRTFDKITSSISFMNISKDIKKIITIHKKKELKLWDVENGESAHILKGHSFFINCAIFSPNDEFVLSGGVVGEIILWNAKNGKKIKSFIGHTDEIKQLAFFTEKIIVSASLDGTIKFWDIELGKELLTLVVLKDGEWIAITPEGYFNASKNGAEHLNVLTGPMSVTSVDAYYETFYRPNIVKAALEGKTVDTGITLQDVKPAPEVKIINTPSKVNSDEVDISLKITGKGGGIGDIRLYLNGVSVKTDSRAVTRANKKVMHKSFTLKLPKGKNEIKVLVFNEANTMESNEALHAITADYKIVHKPELHAIVIGIDKFKNPKLQLKYAGNDAKLFADTITTQSKGLFSKVIIHKLDTEEKTTKEAITQKLKELQNLNPDDLFVFYVASHGTVDDGEYFLLTSNVGSTSTRKLKSDAINQTDLKRLIANVPTTKKLIILDTCNAGAMGDVLLTRGMSEDTAMKILSRAVGSTILSAATSQQNALEGYKNHGLFTYVLSEGLKGKADSNGDGYIKTLELANYIDDEVPEIAQREFQRAQYPVVSPSGQAFPIGKVK